MAGDVVGSWARLIGQLQAAGVTTQRFTEAMAGVTCCQPEIGMSPAGVPFTVHEPTCRGLEERLAAAVFQVPTDTEVEMQAQEERMAALSRRLYRLTGQLHKLTDRWIQRRDDPPTTKLGGQAYAQGAANAYGRASTELAEVLTGSGQGTADGSPA